MSVKPALEQTLTAGRPIELGDLLALTRGREGLSAELSDSAFANLFLFRDVHGYRLHEATLPHVRGFAYDGTELIIPLFKLADVPYAALRGLVGEAGWLYPFCEVDAARHAETFDASWNDADSDYIYAAERMRSFQGLKKRRQQLLRFQEDFGPRATLRALTNDDALLAARQVLDGWQRESDTVWSETDYTACAEGLTHRARLGLFGLLVEVDNQPAGFMLASALSARMAAVHFAKGLGAFPGVYQFMFRAFARVHEKFEFLNFEQDLGKPRFRQAKQSYRPLYLARKYRLRPKP